MKKKKKNIYYLILFVQIFLLCLQIKERIMILFMPELKLEIEQEFKDSLRRIVFFWIKTLNCILFVKANM